MKKQYLIYTLLAVMSLYTIGGFFGVPYLIKHRVPDIVADVTKGGKFKVESASFNPFIFRLSLQNGTFKSPKNGDLVAIKSLSINVNPLDYLWRGKWVVESIHIEKPQISLAKDVNGEMNFGWLLGSDENETKEPSQPLALLIEDFTLKNGKIEYADISEGKNYHESVNGIGFHVEHINLQETSKSKGALRLYATINDSGFIDLRGKIISMKPFALNGSVAFNSGKLYTAWRYFKEKLPIEVADGTAAFSLDYALSAEDINATKLSHVQIDLNSLRFISKGEERKLLDVGSVKISDATVWPMRKVLDANALKLNGLALNASRSRDGVIDWLEYMEQIKKAFPEDENETKIPWTFNVRDVALENMGATWDDRAPKIPYTAALEGVSAYAQNVSSDPQKTLNLQLKTGKFGARRLSDKVEVLDFESLEVDQISLEQEGKNIQVNNVTLEKMSASLKRLRNGALDVQGFVYIPPKNSTEESKSPWSYRLDRFALKDSKVNFLDEVPVRPVGIHLDRLNADVRRFSSNPRETMEIELSARVNQKTTLALSSALRRVALQAKGDFELNHFSLPLIDPYIESSTYAALRRGDLGLKGSYSYTPEKMFIDGKLALEDWVVEDRRDKSVLLGWNRIGVTPFVYHYPDNRLKINYIAVDGLYTNVLIDQNKTLNFSTLSKVKKSDANGNKKGGNAFGIDVVKLSLLNSSAAFSDLSLPLPFKTYTHDLSGEVLGISTTKDVTTFVKLRGGVDQYGLAKIDGNINTNAPKNFTNMRVAFENLELKQYTPYSLKFLGYKITGGKLFLNLGYKIDQGKLNSQNQIVIKKIELGDEQAGGSKWPMGLVVALLEDSDGVIDIDLPIEGDVNNPDFKYGKVVWQVIGNLLTKAITAPFRLLGAMMGLEADDDSLSNVSFEAGEETLLPPQREKLDKLATLLIKRPKLILTVHGGWALSEDERALRIQKLIKEVMGTPSKEGVVSVEVMSLEALEETAKKSIDSKELRELRNAMKEKYTQEAEYTHRYSAALIEKLIPLQVLAQPELAQLAAKRSLAIVEYLHKNPDLLGRVSAGANEKSTFDPKEGVATRLELRVK